MFLKCFWVCLGLPVPPSGAVLAPLPPELYVNLNNIIVVLKFYSNKGTLCTCKAPLSHP